MSAPAVTRVPLLLLLFLILDPEGVDPLVGGLLRQFLSDSLEHFLHAHILLCGNFTVGQPVLFCESFRVFFAHLPVVQVYFVSGYRDYYIGLSFFV